MTSISDGSLPEDQAKVFARQYAKELQEEKDEATKKIVDERNYKPGDNALRGLDNKIDKDLVISLKK